MKTSEIRKYVLSSCGKHGYFKEASSAYMECLISSLEEIGKILKDENIEVLIKDKLQFEKQYDRKELIQSLCEVTVGYYLVRNFPGSVSYEKNIDPSSGKDVDYQYMANGTTINLEVKCARYDASEKVHAKDGFFLGFWGRHPEYQEQYNSLNLALKEGQELSSVEKVRALFLEKHMDYNLFEFLKSTHEKVGGANAVDNYNVLVLGANNQQDLDQNLGYLLGHEGMFTPKSFSSVSEYANVDAILITNMYYKHNNKSCLEDGSSLLFEKCFAIIQLNYFPAIYKPKALTDFQGNIHHLTDELIEFSKKDFAPPEIKLPTLISSYIAYEAVSDGYF